MNDVATTEMTRNYRAVIRNICDLDWAELDRSSMTAVAWAYYYFSIQFRENLEVACRLYPDDPALERLLEEECATDNLSPWPDVASVGEKLNHDEFMRRVLKLSPIDPETQQRVVQAGCSYLSKARGEADSTRAMSLTSYEDGGLESVFKAMLRCECWDTPLLQGFRHFLIKHIGFDSNPDEGHGALIRHLVPDDRIHSIWMEFHNLLVTAVDRGEKFNRQG